MGAAGESSRQGELPVEVEEAKGVNTVSSERKRIRTLHPLHSNKLFVLEETFGLF